MPTATRFPATAEALTLLMRALGWSPALMAGFLGTSWRRVQVLAQGRATRPLTVKQAVAVQHLLFLAYPYHPRRPHQSPFPATMQFTHSGPTYEASGLRPQVAL